MNFNFAGKTVLLLAVLLCCVPVIALADATTTGSSVTNLLTETFADSNFSSRGWYDNTSFGVLATSGCYPASTCLEWDWAASGVYPTNVAGSMRHALSAPSNTLYVKYYMKTSSNWVGSGYAYDPHTLMLLSTYDATYEGPAYAYLCTMLEMNGNPNHANFGIQDSELINTSYGTPPISLVGVTENRAVGGCNGNPGAVGTGINCYESGGYWYNGRMFLDTTALSNNVWHEIEYYLQMNTIVGGVSQANGIFQLWVDGVQTQNITNMVYLTDEEPTKEWNQFLFGPYFGNGSPIAQSMWIGYLEIDTARPSSGGALTGIGAISGTTQVGSTLTAGAVTPSGATVTYQWSHCTTNCTSGGTYTNISGATSNTYTLQSSDLNDYIEVTATGTGSYTGTETSAYVGPVTATTSGETLAAPTFSPAGGTYSSSQSVTISSTAGSTICYSTSGVPAGSSGSCTTGTAIASGSSVTVSTSETLYAIATEAGLKNSASNSAAYTITYTVSGTITPASLGNGATVTLSQNGTIIAVTTASKGTYGFTNVAPGTYTVTPNEPRITFTPTSQSVTVSGGPVTVSAFSATTSGRKRY